jgi:tetratricopeptide (TPR) repeat protein
MPGRVEKTVFISYRRTNFPWAYCIYQDLTHHGYDVFFDYQNIDSGSFEKVILENIKARAHFIIILSPSALERCNQPGDWVRREIETAIDNKRNIIPVTLEGFDFGSPSVKQALTGKLASLNTFNGMSLVAEYVEAGFEKLRNRFLNVALEDVHLKTLTEDAKEITANQKAAANEAPPVEKQELTAQEWFERGYVFATVSKNNEEAIRCFSEAIHLNPTDAFAYGMRGVIYLAKEMINEGLTDLNQAIHLNPDEATFFVGRSMAHREINDFENSIIDCTEAIRIRPDYAEVYESRGNLLELTGNLEGAHKDYSIAIKLKPDNGACHASLMSVLRKLGRAQEASVHEKRARELIENESEYNRACFEAVCGNIDKALGLLKVGLEKSQSSKQWARQDIDLENIRNDPRFKELVGG